VDGRVSKVVDGQTGGVFMTDSRQTDGQAGRRTGGTTSAGEGQAGGGAVGTLECYAGVLEGLRDFWSGSAWRVPCRRRQCVAMTWCNDVANDVARALQTWPMPCGTAPPA
jgi:hypothetical protein